MKVNWFKIDKSIILKILDTISEEYIEKRYNPIDTYYDISHLLTYLQQGFKCEDCGRKYDWCGCNYCEKCGFYNCLCKIKPLTYAYYTENWKIIKEYIETYIFSYEN